MELIREFSAGMGAVQSDERNVPNTGERGTKSPTKTDCKLMKTPFNFQELKRKKILQEFIFL